MKLDKQDVQLIVAVFMTALGSALLIAGFCVAPKGEIHESVLIGFGEIMTFAGALYGLDYKYRDRAVKYLKSKVDDERKEGGKNEN